MIQSWPWTHVLLIVTYLVAIASISHMLRHKRSPGSTMAWLLLFILAPLLGSMIYLMFGGRKLRLDKQAREPQKKATTAADRLGWNALAQSYGAYPARDTNFVKLCQSGSRALEMIVGLVDAAESSIALSMFIFASDDSGQKLLTSLIQKAQQGVKVRVLIDGLGSLKTPGRFFEPLERAGGEFAVFKPVMHFKLRAPTNLRNHRKILVVDEQVSFVGGMNVENQEFVSESDSPCWKDVGLLTHGPAARDLLDIFDRDWNYATDASPADRALRQRSLPGNSIQSESVVRSDMTESAVQIIASGPDMTTDSVYSLSLTAIYRARERIWIVTPYFVPNESLVESLVFACQRGVDVRILVPEKSNHRISDFAGAALLRDIQQAGGKILRYPNAMVHAKVMIVDTDFASIGSSNFDMRSLFLNYELLQLVYAPQAIEEIETWFSELASECLVGMPKPGFGGQIIEGIFRSLSPMF